MIAMARSFWFQGIEATPAIASAIVRNFTTDMLEVDIAQHLEWVHAPSRPGPLPAALDLQ